MISERKTRLAQKLKTSQAIYINIIADLLIGFPPFLAVAQSTHFAGNSVTVHHNFIIHAHDYPIFRDDVDVISDDLSHDANAAYSFIQILSTYTTKYYPDMTDLIQPACVAHWQL